jgi:hypothetical protein
MADRFEPRSVLHVVGVLWVVDLPLDSYSIRHWDPLALDQSDFVTFVDISNSVATDTDRGWGCDLRWTHQGAGTSNIYLSNSTRVIKKPPRVGAGV